MSIKRSQVKILIVTLALMFSGCRSLTISMNNSNPPVFTFSTGRFSECCDHLIFLTVSELPTGNTTEAKDLWQIFPLSSTDNYGNHLPRITYGQVPAGFEQKIPASGSPPPLEEGKTYEAFGPLIATPHAVVRFRISNGQAIQLPRD
jgi:hypothetical protein